MKQKNIILSLILVLSLMTASFLVSCGNTDNGSGKTETLEFGESQVTFVIGETRYVSAVYDGESDETITYASDNDSVLTTTSDGLVTALRAGTARITAKVGKLETSMTATVGIGDAIPTLNFTACENDEKLVIGITDGFDLSANVKFRGETYDDAELEYSQNPVLGTITGGVFKPSQKGSTEITVTAKWRNIDLTLTAKVTIEVKHEIELFVNDNVDGGDGEISLFSMKEFCGTTYKTQMQFVPKAYENGNAIEAKCQVISGENSVEYDEANNVLTAKAYGKAQIKVYCVDSLGAEHKKIYNVNVKVPVADYNDEIMFSAYDGDLPLTEIFGEECDIVEAYMGENSITIENNKLKGIESLGTPSIVNVTVSTNKCGYNLKLKVYTRIIKKAEDLDVFTINGKVGEFTGYYLVANDIDATGYTQATGVSYDLTGASGRWFATEGYDKCGLKGTFDGNGHTISNLTVGQCGIFGVINGGTIKNVAFKDLKYSNKSNIATLAWYILDATIENVYMSAASLPAVWARTMVASSIYQSTMNNVIIELGEVLGNTGANLNQKSDLGAYGSFVATNAAIEADGYTPNAFTNVYVISTTKLSVLSTKSYDGENKDSENCYKGIKRYDNVEEMVSAQGNYESFKISGYWDISSGIPVFGK